jgi:hypothetical protein
MIAKEDFKKHIEFHKQIYNEVLSLGKQLHEIRPKEYPMLSDGYPCYLTFSDDFKECYIIDDSLEEWNGEVIFSIPFDWLSMPVDEVKKIVKSKK